MSGYFGGYLLLAILAAIGLAFMGIGLGTNRLLRPVVPTRQKLMTYESGVDAVGDGWSQTQARYYVYAFLYVVFAVDAIFLFPWATVFALPGFGTTSLVEMIIFLGLLAIGLLYAYRRGVLSWT